jgi:uncharacterized protein YgbK (DUF1537 family)
MMGDTQRRLRLGCIADDFTGASDLANNLVRAGMRTVQTIGVLPAGDMPSDADAMVVALKSRTIAAADAVAQSLAACRWLRAAGAEQIYFKVCSTFDSTAEGNIGPVMEALMDALGCEFSIATPAFPDNGRTVFNGHLFVGDVLLSDSGMRHHPLTPMTDANLVRVLQAQLDPARGRRVGLLDHRHVAGEAESIAVRMTALQAEGSSIAIADAVTNDDLVRLGAAVKALPLVCAGSGLAIGLPANGGLEPAPQASRLLAARGHRAIVSGSCSTATLAQVAAFVDRGGAARALDPLQLNTSDAGRAALTADLAGWATRVWDEAPNAAVLVYSSAAPEAVAAVQTRLGTAEAGALIEQALAAVAAALVAHGAGQLVVAGGETSGACVQALQITQLTIGPQIDAGVPWCHADAGGLPLHIALKSGNFGSVDFFTRAFDVLGET